MNNILPNSHIIYERDVHFVIVPTLCNETVKMIHDFINTLKYTHAEFYHTNCFFWKFDKEKNSIVVDNDINIVENNIFDQLVTISYWLYDRKFKLQGTFYCRTENIIEYISMDGFTNLLVHHVLIDVIEDSIIDNEENNTINIMTNAKKKMDIYLNKDTNINNDLQTECSCKKLSSNKFYNNTFYITNVPEMQQNHQIQTEFNMKEKLLEIENKITSINKNNDLFWKASAIFGIIAVSSICLFK
ncbi:hypothetical protein QLL95_gp0746 [Cotonvirus japonicus]|uniref:Uncharacterized protein n=1 Tax=Cotonvirus japonicus TaxID=2811091 RepID=A0ABM7NTH8_9VIRU|nr:hypothetical protein QLL95_gp0746 [Cotonvirus japonicus]BCS83377.1 hypothetical protein [Cotonvirus japonicus]